MTWVAKLFGVVICGLVAGLILAFAVVVVADSFGLVNNLKGERSAKDEATLGLLVLACLGLVVGTPLLFAFVYTVRTAVQKTK